MERPLKPIISPRELAAAIGVSESSLKRWADDGVIQVTKTAGGHRRITIGEAIRFVRAVRAPLLRPDLLGLSDLAPLGDDVVSADGPADRLFRYLREGKAREARALVLSAYLAGQSVAEIADGPIREAMEELGKLWQHDSAGVYVEHRATDICVQAVEQLRLLVEPQDGGAIAIGGGAPGDPYLLPPMLATAALAADGWQAVNLGPDTPFNALLAAAERHQPRVVWLSISSIRDGREIEEGIARLVARLAEREIAFILGGQALSSLALPAIGALRSGKSLSDLIAIANEVRDLRSAGIGDESVRPADLAASPEDSTATRD